MESVSWCRSKKYLDSSGNRLLFAVKKGTYSTVLWKVSIQVACVKIHTETNVISTYRLFNLKEFLQIFQTLKSQYAAIEDSKR